MYCPRGSHTPTPVSAGHYTVGQGSDIIRNSVDSSNRAATLNTEAAQTRIAQALCEE